MRDDTHSPHPLTSEQLEELITRRGARPTPLRALVYNELAKAQEALSQAELEARLVTVDKSTISRSLHLLLSVGAVHQVDDGTGIFKYAPSCAVGGLTPTACKVHFFCQRCEKTFCLPEVELPKIELPEGFASDSYNLVVRGCCLPCQRKRRVQR